MFLCRYMIFLALHEFGVFTHPIALRAIKSIYFLLLPAAHRYGIAMPRGITHRNPSLYIFLRLLSLNAIFEYLFIVYTSVCCL